MSLSGAEAQNKCILMLATDKLSVTIAHFPWDQTLLICYITVVTSYNR